MSTHEESHHHGQHTDSHPTDAASSDVNKPKVTDWTIDDPNAPGKSAEHEKAAKSDVNKPKVTDWTGPKPDTQEDSDAESKP